jgi:hypothetical protein
MSAREAAQFAASHGLDPPAGKKKQPDFEPEWVSHRYPPRPRNSIKPNSAFKSLFARLFGA